MLLAWWSQTIARISHILAWLTHMLVRLPLTFLMDHAQMVRVPQLMMVVNVIHMPIN